MQMDSCQSLSLVTTLSQHMLLLNKHFIFLLFQETMVKGIILYFILVKLTHGID